MLTNIQIKRAKAKEKRYRLSDGDGLFLEVTPQGRKKWVWRDKANGNDRLHNLGLYPDVTLAQARQARTATRDNQLHARSDSTFEEMTQMWLRKRRNTVSHATYERTEKRVFAHLIPALGARPLAEIRPKELVAALQPLEDDGRLELLSRLKNYAGQIFKLGVALGEIEVDPTSSLNRVFMAKRPENNPWLRENELPEFLYLLDRYSPTTSKRVTQMLLLTMVRTSELINMRWEQIDGEVWRIPAEQMKMPRDHVVPLSRQALAILQRQKEISGGLPFVWSRLERPDKPMSRRCVLEVIDRLGYKGRVTGQGFRATASTLLNEHGFNRDVIEAQLAHQPNDVRAQYNHASYMADRSKLLQWYADYLDDLRDRHAASLESA